AQLLALGYFGEDEDRIVRAWEGLIERACLRAAGEGRLRVLARAEDDSEWYRVLRWLGFTAVTREQVYSRAVEPVSAPGGTSLTPVQREETWEVWKLYSRTEPATVQRAEGLTPSTWWRGRRLRSGTRQEWVLAADGSVVLHADLLLGPTSGALEMHYDPEYRQHLPLAIHQAQVTGAARGMRTLYCTVREHQSELDTALQENGFTPMLAQTSMVLYTSVLSYAPERSTAVEKASPVLRTTMGSASRSTGEQSGMACTW
ncbi:MAG: hypothetical protein M3281_07335, partial [Chloroflexota bacterium]|nr:hypothetical protein [Chloroflexota bacterium]